MRQAGGEVDAAAASRLLLAMMRFGRATRRGDAPQDDSGFYLLRIVEVYGPMRMTELAGLAGLDHSTVSRKAATLFEDGKLSRRPDPTDGRASRLELTPLGRETLATSLAQRAAMIAGAMGARTAADLDRVVGVLDDVAANLEDDR
jgi:DNA-binding MarR family transcriptional regulator